LGALAFGSTAIASLGGVTVPGYVAPAGVLLLVTATKRHFWCDLAGVIENQPLVTLVLAITVYAVATAFIFPRLFAGETGVFVPIGYMTPNVPLGPVPGNINRCAYLILSVLVFVAFCMLFGQGRVAEVRRGFLAFAAINAALGLTDVVGKLAGLGDILDPIRTAAYVMMTNDEVNGFFRIAGAFPEASSYACAAALPSLAFAYVDWRHTHSRFSMMLAVVMLGLLFFSTSSSAYAGLGVLLIAYIISVVLSILRGRLPIHHIVVLASGWIAITVLLVMYLLDEHFLDPILQMLLDATFNKGYSESAIERGRWNAQSLQNFIDTFGLGVGLGSTRSSSWPISVIAQLGVVGCVGFMILVLALAKSLLRPQRSEIGALAASASAAAFGWIDGSSFGGAEADPSIIFFVALAAVSASVARAKQASVVRSDSARLSAAGTDPGGRPAGMARPVAQA
jgi:hypothetical protein